MKKLWADMVAEAKANGKMNDESYLLDASIIKSPMGADYTGKSPVGRGRLGAKRSLLTDADGMPIGILSSKANRNDRTLFVATMASSVISLRAGALLKMGDILPD